MMGTIGVKNFIDIKFTLSNIVNFGKIVKGMS